MASVGIAYIANTTPSGVSTFKYLQLFVPLRQFKLALQYCANMVNLRALTSLTYLAQVAVLGSNAHTNSSHLTGIVPWREVLYVGGRYENIVASSRRLASFVTSLSLDKKKYRTVEIILRPWP